MVSGDDRFPEIVGYSDRGTYSEDKLPEGYVDFLQQYKEMVEAVEKGDNVALKTIAEARQMRTEDTKSAEVAPLLANIQWGRTNLLTECVLYITKISFCDWLYSHSHGSDFGILEIPRGAEIGH